MSLDEDQGFTFEWRIRNFSMCPVLKGESIKSPIFKVSRFKNSEWSLELYPSGNLELGKIALFLRCKSLGGYKNGIYLKFYLRLTQLPNKFQLLENTFGADTDWGFNAFASLDEISKDKEKYLPNDTLTVECRIISCQNPSTINKEEKSESSKLDICFVETTIPVQTKRVFWTIGKFQSIADSKILNLSVTSALKDQPSLHVTLSNNDELFPKIKIRKKNKEISDNLFVKCSISVVSASEPDFYRSEDKFLLQGEKVWDFTPFLDLRESKMDDYFKLTRGVLYLQFNFAISVYGREYHSEMDYCKPILSPVAEKFQLEAFLPSTNTERSIVTLKSGDRSFEIHLSLLKARSEIFAAMFENDMQEKGTGVVDIPDVDTDILGHMFAFLYSNTLDDLPITNLIKLYIAADKYQVKCLMCRCSLALLSALDVSNVVEILEAAALLRDERLLEEAIAIVGINRDQVLFSNEWKELMENRAALAAKVLFGLLMK